jgi:recombination protein RecT
MQKPTPTRISQSSEGERIMSTSALKTAVIQQAAPATPKDFPAMLTAWLPEIRRALPKHLNADRMSRIALTAFRRTPKLGECDPRSVFAAVVQASQLGLEPDTLGRSYLIPYKVNKKVGNKWESHYECQFVPGWKGLVDLMNRSGQGSAWTGAVFNGDEFDYQLGDNPFVHHKPGDAAGDKLIYTYAIGRPKGSDYPIVEVWPIAKVWKHRDRYNKVGDKHYSYENPEMYARKVPLLQVLKYMPCSAELASAIALNDDAEVGKQNINMQDAIEGTYEAATVDVETGEISTGAAKAGDGPTLEDCVRLIQDTDYDAARDLAMSISPEVAVQVGKMIENHRKGAEKA